MENYVTMVPKSEVVSRFAEETRIKIKELTKALPPKTNQKIRDEYESKVKELKDQFYIDFIRVIEG